MQIDFRATTASIVGLLVCAGRFPDCCSISVETFDRFHFDDALWLMERFDLLPTDAFHIAIAQSFGINVFVSLDPEFARVDGIIVYTP